MGTGSALFHIENSSCSSHLLNYCFGLLFSLSCDLYHVAYNQFPNQSKFDHGTEIEYKLTWERTTASVSQLHVFMQLSLGHSCSHKLVLAHLFLPGSTWRVLLVHIHCHSALVNSFLMYRGGTFMLCNWSWVHKIGNFCCRVEM